MARKPNNRDGFKIVNTMVDAVKPGPHPKASRFHPAYSGDAFSGSGMNRPRLMNVFDQDREVNSAKAMLAALAMAPEDDFDALVQLPLTYHDLANHLKWCQTMGQRVCDADELAKAVRGLQLFIHKNDNAIKRVEEVAHSTREQLLDELTGVKQDYAKLARKAMQQQVHIAKLENQLASSKP